MGKWTREEIEQAFETYQKAARQAGTTGDWRSWADLFTEDATYVEHHYGRVSGREAIFKWISAVMRPYPVSEMKLYPIEWYVIDEARGWVVCYVWNRMSDPGDGSLHQESNFTLLKYAGNGKWSYEEDDYNPLNFRKMIKRWREVKDRCAKDQDPIARRFALVGSAPDYRNDTSREPEGLYDRTSATPR
jgi:uncharacterized protein (TIGR02246 family)